MALKLNRPVALKLLPPRHSVQSALRERFVREAQTAARALSEDIGRLLEGKREVESLLGAGTRPVPPL